VDHVLLRAATTDRFTFNDGVNSPVSTEKSRSSRETLPSESVSQHEYGGVNPELAFAF
jgi:hypothetical protein